METQELADWAPCNTPHRHLSAVRIEVRASDAASNLEEGSGLRKLPYPQPKKRQPDSTSFAGQYPKAHAAASATTSAQQVGFI